MKRILIFINSFSIGGTENQAVLFLKHINTQKYHLTICTLNREGKLLNEIQNLTENIHEFKIPSFLNPVFLFQLIRLIRLIRKERIELVHTTDFYTNVFGVIAAKVAGFPRIICSRRDLNVFLSRYKQYIQRRLCCLADAIITNSHNIKRFLLEYEKMDKRKIVVIPNGIDLNIYSGVYDPEEITSEFALDRYDNIIIMIANMNDPIKGHTVLLDAAQRVIRVCPKTGFLLVGEGMLRPKYEQYAKDMGLSYNLVFAGLRRDVPALLSCADISVLPSYSEGFPNALLESMAAGKPIVATKAAGAEIIRQDETGFLVPTGDPKALAEKILFLLENEHLRRDMGLRGRMIAENTYSIDEMLKSFESIYDRLLG
ncbi:MAG: glycosyltransferase [Candidatus Hodarchaeota archaeon]